MPVDTRTADHAYFTKSNIVHPGTAAEVAAAEARARTELGVDHSANAAATVTGGAIKRG